MAGKSRAKPADFVSVTVGDANRVVGMKREDFPLLARAAAGGCKIADKATEQHAGELARLGLVKWFFPVDHGGWPQKAIQLTRDGAQALAQDPSIGGVRQ